MFLSAVSLDSGVTVSRHHELGFASNFDSIRNRCREVRTAEEFSFLHVQEVEDLMRDACLLALNPTQAEAEGARTPKELIRIFCFMCFLNGLAMLLGRGLCFFCFFRLLAWSPHITHLWSVNVVLLSLSFSGYVCGPGCLATT